MRAEVSTDKEIRDPIHGYVRLDSLALDLLSTPQVQRLRWIRQLGLANLVYPGASHSRFEHSLGTYHLASIMAGHLGLDGGDKQRICAAALLHDIGHGPFSHATEAVLSAYLRQGHESIIDLLKGEEIRSVLEGSDIGPQELQALIRGEAELGRVVNGEIDVDRMDYLIRDAHYTGVAYGVFDHLRLLTKMKMHRGRMVVEEGGLKAAESLLVSRLLMYPTVYFHHVCRISEAMIREGIRQMIDEGGIPAAAIKGMDDDGLFTALFQAGGFSREMAIRIKSRHLFKRAIYVGRESLDHPTVGWGEQWIAREIADEAGIDPRYVLVDNPPMPDVPEGGFPTLIDGRMVPLREVSPLVNILERAHRANWRLGVYCRSEDRAVVAKAARSCLNLRRNAIQHTLVGAENG
ncbi:MAG: HD domain-containing protein [Methanotrichaceae archaeon]|nr:HD domain-containing protein [Methanotrichaceae archaeon]